MNTLTDADRVLLTNRFMYHAPKGDQSERYETLRALARQFAEGILHMCPESRERSVALTELETSIMWANASIARNE